MPNNSRPTRGMLILAVIALVFSCDPPDFPDFPGFPGCVPAKLHKLDLKKRKQLKLVELKTELGSGKISSGLGAFKDPDAVGKPPKDRRLALTGRAPNSGGYLFLERTFQGAFDTRVTVAFDGRKGLDEVFGSVAELRVDHPDTAPLELYIIQAQVLPLAEHDGASDDVAIFVFDKDHLDGSLGPDLVFPDAHQVDLRIQHTATEVIYQARPSVGNEDPETPSWTTVASVAALPSESDFRVGIGALGLGKGGRFFFDGMSLAGDALVQGDELELAGEVLALGAGLQNLRDELAASAEGDLIAFLDAICVDTEELTALVEQTLEQGDLPAGDDAVLALKTLAKLKKKLLKAAKLLPGALESSGEGENPKPLANVLKLLDQAIACNCVLMANLAGIRARHVDDIPLVPLADGED